MRRTCAPVPTSWTGSMLTGSGEVGDRLWAHPSINAIGVDMMNIAGSSNVLIPEASAKISMRIVPGADPVKELDALVTHLETHAPWGAQGGGHAYQGGAPVPVLDRRTGLRRGPLGVGAGLRQAGGRGGVGRIDTAAAHPAAGGAQRRVHPLGRGGHRPVPDPRVRRECGPRRDRAAGRGSGTTAAAAHRDSRQPEPEARPSGRRRG